jgi:hypothetical protein
MQRWRNAKPDHWLLVVATVSQSGTRLRGHCSFCWRLEDAHDVPNRFHTETASLTGRVFLVSATHYDGEFRHGEQRLYSIFQYGTDYETGQRLSDEELMEHVKEDLKLMGGTVISIEGQRRWDYFPHPRVESMKDGFFERLESLQGVRNTFYAGSTLNFELTETTVRYSRKLAETFFPLSDETFTTPDESKTVSKNWSQDFRKFMLDFDMYCKRGIEQQGSIVSCEDYDGSKYWMLTDLESCKIVFDPEKCAKVDYLGAQPFTLFRSSF